MRIAGGLWVQPIPLAWVDRGMSCNSSRAHFFRHKKTARRRLFGRQAQNTQLRKTIPKNSCFANLFRFLFRATVVARYQIIPFLYSLVSEYLPKAPRFATPKQTICSIINSVDVWLKRQASLSSARLMRGCPRITNSTLNASSVIFRRNSFAFIESP